jgi:hypothetical protein
MTNHLRIALKHLFAEQNTESEIVLGNYRVDQRPSLDTGIIAIDHLKFNGEDEFHTCKWDLRDKTMVICEGNNCPAGEIIFVLRTIRKLGCEIEHVFYEARDDNVYREDISQLFARYLSN